MTPPEVASKENAMGEKISQSKGWPPNRINVDPSGIWCAEIFGEHSEPYVLESLLSQARAEGRREGLEEALRMALIRRKKQNNNLETSLRLAIAALHQQQGAGEK